MGSYLYSNAGFLAGVARLFDFGNTDDEYNRTPKPNRADSIGILYDWATVGDDIWNVISELEFPDAVPITQAKPESDAQLASREL
jgi:hypothetical protein